MRRLSFISGVAGLELTEHERAFFKEAVPLGLILFARNLSTAEQIRKLIDDVRDAVGAEQFWVLIDQEGGRVQRLRPPLFPALPPMRRLGELYRAEPEEGLDTALSIARLMGQRLLEFGINVNCTPVLDLPQPGADEIIGDRSFGADVQDIVAVAGKIAEGHLLQGVLPVIKHIPGHGRAEADSHKALPVIEAPLEVLRETDFEPFRRLNHLPLAMTAHVLMTAVDAHHPVSVSSMAIDEVIRGEIGFDGFVMSDDVSMEALAGDIGCRTAACLKAGCDAALHCNGELSEMEQVAQNSTLLAGRAEQRFAASFDMIASHAAYDETRALAFLAACESAG